MMMEQKKETGSSSVSDCCPICLGPILQDSYLDQCFHKFCYNCILHWTKVVAAKNSCPPSSVKCPLCKTENLSIIHAYDGSSFQQHHINQNSENSVFFSKTHKYRLKCYYIQPGSIISNFNVSRYWKSRKYLQPNRWLFSWLRREIQALIQEEDVDVIVHHILGVIDSWRRNEQKCSRNSPETNQEDFKVSISQAARPFLSGRTDRFVNEIELFLASGLNIEAYDKVYLQHLDWKIPEIIPEDEEEEFHEHTPLVPYLCFSDEDCYGTG